MEERNKKKIEDEADFNGLVESVSFELERDLRLHPQKLELGKMELLTDSVRLSFTSIQNRLREFVLVPTPALRDELCAAIKRYLAVLNSNPFFPLAFRLKVLDVLEKHLDLFDVEITSQVLNAHKIGIQLVQREARDKPEYRGVLINLVANALELAEKLLFETLRLHHAPHVIAMRQALDLMRLGLLVAPSVGEEHSEDIHRLNSIVAAHELLRCMDLYARSDAQQQMVRQELKRYSERVAPVLYGRGKPLPQGANVYLVTSTTQPHLPPMKLTRLPELAENDVVVMPLDGFLAGINRDLKLAKRVMDMGPGERKLLMTEHRFQQISQGTAVIRRSLQSVSRKNSRHRVEGVRTLLDTNLSEAFDYYSDRGLCLSDGMLNDAERRQAWSVVNVSKTGAALLRMGSEWPDVECGALIGLRWIGERAGSGLAIVRWYRESKPGEQSMGIEFVGTNLKATRGMLVGDQAAPMSRRCSLLFDPEHPRHVWFPYKGIEVGDKLIYLYEGEGVRCHVDKVLSQGPNFTCCKLAFDSMDGKYFTVQAESLL